MSHKSQKVKEHPIPCYPHEVRGILDGRQTQLRRVIKPQPDEDGICYDYSQGGRYDTSGRLYKCPYGQAGDRLWVREAWRCRGKHTDQYSPSEIEINKAHFEIAYQASITWNDDIYGRICPPIHMPRCASRITLEITDIKVERVQDITKEGVFAEGINKREGEELEGVVAGWHEPFASLWNSINEKRGFGWDVNPWVWCVSFKRLE